MALLEENWNNMQMVVGKRPVVIRESAIVEGRDVILPS